MSLPLREIATKALALFPEDCEAVPYKSFAQILMDELKLTRADAVRAISELKDRGYLEEHRITSLTLNKKRDR